MDDQPPARRTRRDRTVMLTDRDRLMLAFAAEHRLVLAGQIAVGLGITPAAATARMRALRAGGYLQGERNLHGEPPFYQITSSGLRAIGSDLPRPRKPDLSCYRHDVGLGWLMLVARAARFGPGQDVISERRMRSDDGRPDRGDQRWGVRLGGVGPGGRERLHYPDMILETAGGHRVAFELELSAKAPSRREGILAAYAADRRIDAVVYLVDRRTVGLAIDRSAARLGVSAMVHVRNVSLDFGGRAGGHGAPAQRSRRRGMAGAHECAR